MIKLHNSEPFFFCEHCQKQIKHCEDGVALSRDWDFEDAGVLSIHEIAEATSAMEADPTPIVYLHNPCLDAYEAEHGLQGKTVFDHLREHLSRLLHNTGFFGTPPPDA